MMRCTAERENGELCNTVAIGPEGRAKLLARGYELREEADRKPLCNWHSVTPESRRKMQQKGGRLSTKKKVEQAPSMERATRLNVDLVVRSLLSAKIGNESDFRQASVGAFIAAVLFDMTEDFTSFARHVLPNDIKARAAEAEEVAQQELDEALESLGYRTVEEWLALRAENRFELLLADT
jgi:hypothetical protein